MTDDPKKLDLICPVEDSNGQAKFNTFHRRAIQDTLRRYIGDHCRIRIEPPPRSLDQNAYMHAIFSSIASFMHDSGVRGPEGDKIPAEAWKIYFKRKYGPIDVHTLPDGSVVDELRSTAKYNKSQMTAFIEQVRHDDLIIDSGHYIQTPEEFMGPWKR